LTVNLPIAPTQFDPETLVDFETAFRQRVRKRFAEDVPYYIELSGETTEAAAGGDGSQAPRSARRRRQRMRAEYREWIQEGRDVVRVKLNTLREAVDKYPCVILLGDPGCGKTTALQQLAYEVAGEDGRLPLPLRLSEFAPKMSMEDFIANGWGGAVSAGHWNAFELADNLNGYLDNGKLFCLFDALNEMPHEGYGDRARALRSFINSWSSRGNRFLVTCRVLDYGEELSGLQRVEIQPLSHEQIEDFVKRELPETWGDLWQELTEEGDSQRSLLRLARNPYMLTVMIDVFEEDGQLGHNRAELMRRFTEILMGRARETCSPENCLDADVQRDALAVMAYEIQDRAGFGTLVKTTQAKAVMPEQVQPDPNWPPVPSPPDQVLDLAASAHIIEMTGDKSSLRFYHQLLQEYYAAREMLKREPDRLEKMWRWPWLEEEMPKWIRPDDNYDPLPPPPPTDWEETTILAAGLMPENDDQLVRALIEVNPVLAGRCLHAGQAKVTPEIRRAVVDRLLATISHPEVALRVRIAAGEVLGYLGDPRIGEMVPVPSGKFWIGDDEGDEEEKPRHRLFLSKYQIGKCPVTNAEFSEFIGAGGYKEKRWWTKAGWTLKKKENWSEPRDWGDGQFNKANQPVVSVSWYECIAYCRWLSSETGQSYHLPSEVEWEKAARGTDGRQYPWGNEFETGRLNSGEGEQIVEATTPVGIYPTGESPYGCLDMAGNVWEWTSTQFRDYKYNPGDGREDPDAEDEVLRVLRGGSWGSNQGDARCSCRYWDDPDFGFDHFGGFRVVVSPISAL
jgi:formylglycine-generating enzyme required for sulfatase activity